MTNCQIKHVQKFSALTADNMKAIEAFSIY